MPDQENAQQPHPIKRPTVMKARCVHAHSPEALCRLCQYACPSDAIIIDNGSLSIIADACIGCGVCSSVCPTGAIIPSGKSTQLIWSALQEASIIYGRTYLACYRAGIEGSSESAISMPCLGELPPEFWFKVITESPETKVYLPEGICDECPCTTGEEVMMDAIAQAERWSQGSLGLVDDPGALAFAIYTAGAEEVDRRGLFENFAKRAKNGVEHASINDAATQLELRKVRMRNSMEASKRAKRQRDARFAEAKRTGKLRRSSRTMTTRRSLLEEVLEKHPGLASSTRIETVFAHADACTHCAKCAEACPLGALFVSDSEVEVDDMCCTGCGLCVELCPTGAMEMIEMDAEGLFAPDGESAASSGKNAGAADGGDNA